MRGDRMMRFGQNGAASSGAANSRARISASQSSSWPGVRALAVGKAPITPLRQAATTRSTPETLSIGRGDQRQAQAAGDVVWKADGSSEQRSIHVA